LSNLAIDFHKDNLIKVLDNNSMCCPACFDMAVTKLLKDIKENNLNSIAKKELSNKRYIHLRDLDPIAQGKIFEYLFKIITNINPFDKFKVYKLAGLEKQLEYFFSDIQLDNLFKDTYIGQIRKARKKMVIDRRRQVKNIEKKQLEEKRLRLLKKDWELSKRKMSKKARDAKRLRYIKEFSSFDPIEKLKLILHDQIKFPLISIPDEALFKADLLIRYQVNKNFTSKELDILKGMFQRKRKKDRGVNWISILRAF